MDAEVILVVLVAVLLGLGGLLVGLALAALALRPGGRFTWQQPAGEPMSVRSQARSDEEEARYLAELDEVMDGLAADVAETGRMVTPAELRKEARDLLDAVYETRVN